MYIDQRALDLVKHLLDIETKSKIRKNKRSSSDIEQALIEKEELLSCIMKAGVKEGIPEKKLMKSLRKAKEGKRKHLMKISTFVTNDNCSIN